MPRSKSIQTTDDLRQGVKDSLQRICNAEATVRAELEYTQNTEFQQLTKASNAERAAIAADARRAAAAKAKHATARTALEAPERAPSGTAGNALFTPSTAAANAGAQEDQEDQEAAARAAAEAAARAELEAAEAKKQKTLKTAVKIGATIVVVLVITGGAAYVIMSPTAMAVVTAKAATAQAALANAYQAGIALMHSAVAYGRTDLLPAISQFLTFVSNQITAFVNAHPTAVHTTAAIASLAVGTSTVVAAGAYVFYKRYNNGPDAETAIPVDQAAAEPCDGDALRL